MKENKIDTTEKILSSKLNINNNIPRKPPYVDHNLLKKIIEINSGKLNVKEIKTYSRRSTILPEMIGITICVHNGRKCIPIYIVETMIGYKLGEFVSTRTFKGHPDKNKKNLAAKKKGGK